MSFVYGSQMLLEAKNIVQAPGEVRLAVAYWGKGASNLLGLDKIKSSKKKRDVKIILDLDSGCCSPSELEFLYSMKPGGIKVRYLNNLHAKVYSSERGSLVGSSNASTNGLGEDGAEYCVKFEAGLLDQSPKTATNIKKWFRSLWRIAHELDEEAIKHAKKVWNGKARPKSSTKTLTETLNLYPNWLSDKSVRLVCYFESQVSSKAEEIYEREAKFRGLPKVKDSEVPFFEDDSGWQVNPGDLLLCFPCSRKGVMPKFDGIWEVCERPRVPIDGSNLGANHIIVLKKAGCIYGKQFPPKEQKLVASMLKSLLDRRVQKWSEDEHHSLVDEAFGEFWSENLSLAGDQKHE